MTEEKRKEQLAKRVIGLRTATGLNQTEFAALVGVKQSVISAWENEGALPSGQNYFRLGSIASDYESTKWFWEQAGIDFDALDRFIDMRMHKKKAQASGFIEISAHDGKANEKLSFQSGVLTNPASTRFLRLIGENYPFKSGDISLIDFSVTDLRKLQEQELIVVGHGGQHYVGVLEKKSYVGPKGGGVRRSTNQTWFVLQGAAHGKNLIIATASANGPVETEYSILGRMVAWIHQGEHGRNPSDSYHIHAAGHVPRSEEELARLRKLAEKDEQFPEQKKK
jgi:transcriptional regulator with XRE-family HTH domain